MGILHAFFLPRTAEEARGVVARLMARACAVVADAFPSFTIPQQNAAAAAKAPCRYVVVDDCAGLPLALFPKQEFAARTLRPKVARAMADWLRPVAVPAPRVEARALDLPFDPVRWSSASIGELVARCAIDHEVGPVRSTVGGSSRAEGLLERFVAYKLPAYASDRNDPTRDIGSSLSPYLHFGMISARRVAVEAIAGGIRRKLPDGALAGFLEQLLVRRGLAYNFAARQPRHADYEALPAWAIETLETHRKDVRPWLGTARELEAAKTPDALWNACQWELRLRGTIQSYARMLWGKLPIQWMADPREAHRVLVYLNDKYALDGRDPDGYASVSWCFGLHDRPWPVHACFGKVRTMTSKSARSKFDFDSYIRAMADLRASSD
jgi:deoxyribodipyrimidine photo-lyase